MIFIMLVTSACFKELPTEEPTIERERMEVILKDIHLAESMIAEVADRRKKDSLARVYYTQVFAIHQVDSANFEQSMRAYFSNPDALVSLYSGILQKIAREKEEVLRQKKAKKN